MKFKAKQTIFNKNSTNLKNKNIVKTMQTTQKKILKMNFLIFKKIIAIKDKI